MKVNDNSKYITHLVNNNQSINVDNSQVMLITAYGNRVEYISILLDFIGYAISLVIVKNWIVCKQFIFIVIIFIMISKLIQIITIVVIIFGSLAA